MAPPPAQKGKFKPRKPVKKNTATDNGALGSSSSGDAVSANPVTSTVAFAPSTDNAKSRDSRGDGRGGGNRDNSGGRGRGGRGRGRGRAPIPSGRVVFTGSDKPSSSSGSKRRSSVGSSLSAANRIRNKDQEQTEEVVGQLDIAIGTSKDKKSSASTRQSSDANAMDYDHENERGGEEKIVKGSFAMEGFMYDSDSSKEEERASRRKQHSKIIPLELPLPSKPWPLGVGTKERPIAYANVTSSSADDPDPGVGAVNQDLAEPSVSPFVPDNEMNALTWEQNQWFLVQLPTRLPPMQPSTTDGPNPTYSMDMQDPMDESTANDELLMDQPISDVVTPPLAGKSHDNVLSKTAAGRIGKILVHKSGRTVLKMEGPDGSSPILMDVNEGLSCGFLQQVVVIDAADSRFVALGTVAKSIVVTPDLSTAFA